MESPQKKFVNYLYNQTLTNQIADKKKECFDILRDYSENKISQIQFEELSNYINEWIWNPIFTNEKSLIASAIFAKWFWEVLCTSNLQYIEQLAKKDGVDIETQSLGMKIKKEFTEDQDWNLDIHNNLLDIENKLKSVPQSSHVSIALFLMEQIIGEIATNTISKLNEDKDNVFQSHYFDFVDSMMNETPDLLLQYKKLSQLETKYIEGLENILSQWDDALIAVSLMSEAFIGLTYQRIIDVVNALKNKNNDYRTLLNFYKWHIDLDWVEKVWATDTHFYMICQILSQVDNRNDFMIYCKDFISLRNEVHNNI